jgi:CBS domain-containing protein
MKVADIMTRGVLSLSPKDSMRRAAERMLQYGVSGFPVLDSGKLVGIVTQGDFLRRAASGTDGQPLRWSEFFSVGGSDSDRPRAHARTVGEVMTRDIVTVSDDTALDAAVELMERYHVKRLPVVKNGVLIGIVSRVDLLHAFIIGTSPRQRSNDS